MNEAAKKVVAREARRAAMDCAESASYGMDVEKMCADAWAFLERAYGEWAGARGYFEAIFYRLNNQEAERVIEVQRRRGR